MSDLTIYDVARFWPKVEMCGSGNCWEWFGKCDRKGYGRFYFAGREHAAHRVSYQIANGVDPGDKHVCHSCDNPPCCNPAHLWLGTLQDNMADRTRKGRGPRKLTEHQVREARLLLKAGLFQHEVGSRFGVTQGTISALHLGKTWKSVD